MRMLSCVLSILLNKNAYLSSVLSILLKKNAYVELRIEYKVSMILNTQYAKKNAF